MENNGEVLIDERTSSVGLGQGNSENDEGVFHTEAIIPLSEKCNNYEEGSTNETNPVSKNNVGEDKLICESNRNSHIGLSAVVAENAQNDEIFENEHIDSFDEPVDSEVSCKEDDHNLSPRLEDSSGNNYIKDDKQFNDINIPNETSSEMIGLGDVMNKMAKLKDETVERMEDETVERIDEERVERMEGETIDRIEEERVERMEDESDKNSKSENDVDSFNDCEDGGSSEHNDDKTNIIHGTTCNKVQDITKTTVKESALQRLANLGVIGLPAEENPIESKENLLKKLASRGSISITPAGGCPLPSSSCSSVSLSPSIKPSPVKPSVSKTIAAQIKTMPSQISSAQVSPTFSTIKPSSSQALTPTTVNRLKYKPGPKSAMIRQKAKKIKIDPGKSLDIEKDFNSLINILSTGADLENSALKVDQEKAKSEEIAPQSVPDTKQESSLEINDSSIDQNTNDGHSSGMDIDNTDDRSVHETDSESHDESKSFSHSSENYDKGSTTGSSQVKSVIEEGSAEILLSATKNVFYNKVQEFNRDMSIAALTVFSEMHQQDPRTRNRGKKRKERDSSEADSNHANIGEENIFEPGKKSENGITILEALSATGLRSIRYAREIPGVKEVFANDLSEDAVETIKKNIEHNGVSDLVTTSMSDASMLMYQRQTTQQWYDAIDLDPYGCPSRFLDSAVQAVRDGGLLLVTCTDMAVLAGNSPETCFYKYGAVSLRSSACHEMALRIALQCIESHANRYGRYIVPLLSFSCDFYIRLIVQVYTSPSTCKKTTSKLAMVYQCVGCHTHTLHPLGQMQAGQNTPPKFSLVTGPPVNTNCFHCNHKHLMGGPIWSAPLYSHKFLESMLKVVEEGNFPTSKRMQGMLEVIREELLDVPLYYTISSLCGKLHCQAIPLIDIRSAILNAGYRVSASHAVPTAIKTNAPSKIIWDIMRCWVHMNPVSQKRLVPGSVTGAIILEPPNLIANFDIHPKARPSSSMRKLLRYQQNPEKNWGPGTRAKCNNGEDIKDDKRRANQNKNQKKKPFEIIEVVTIDDEDEATEETVNQETTATTSST